MNEVTVCSLKLVREKEVDYVGSIGGVKDAVELAREFGFEEFAEEVAGLFCVDACGHVVAYHEVSRGTLTSTLVSPREVYKRAILHNSIGIILVHNHPSGEVVPSNEDYALTKKMVDAGEILECRLVDHIIIGDKKYHSMKDEGFIE